MGISKNHVAKIHKKRFHSCEARNPAKQPKTSSRVKHGMKLTLNVKKE